MSLCDECKGAGVLELPFGWHRVGGCWATCRCCNGTGLRPVTTPDDLNSGKLYCICRWPGQTTDLLGDRCPIHAPPPVTTPDDPNSARVPLPPTKPDLR